MHHPLRRSFTLIVGLAALLVGGIAPVLAQDASTASERGNPFVELGLPEIAITITETAFEGGPTELAAGRYILTVTNALEAGAGSAGRESSGVNFLQLPDSLTVETFIAMMGAYGTTPEAADVAASPAVAGSQAPPAWFYEAVFPGGPYARPGEPASTVIDLTAGSWVLWGEFPGARQAPVPVTVTGEAPAGAPAVNADSQITMVEYAFVAPPTLPAGSQVIEIANVGQEPHFFTLARVPEGTTVEEGLAAISTRFDGPAATPAGGLSSEDLTIAFVMGTQSAGVTAWYTADLTPGTYLAVCFVPDPVQGIPHAMYGMTQIIEVEEAHVTRRPASESQRTS